MIELRPIDAKLADPGSVAARAATGSLDIARFVVPRRLDEIPVPEDRFVQEERDLLVETLESRLAAYEPPVAVLDALRSMRNAGASFVVSGQQPGFLCAPLYNVYKALHTVRLARALAQAWERPVVPLFWNHADDHDLAEVHHVHVLNQNLDVQKIVLSGMSSGRQPLGRLRFDAELHNLDAVRSNLARIPGEPAFVQESLDALMPLSGETFAEAFTRGMTTLFGHLGLVVLEPEWIRADLSRALARVVENDVLDALRRGTSELAEAGFEPAIDPHEAALLFRVDDAGRQGLRAGGEGFRYDGEEGSRTPSELAAEIVQEPGNWSAGALLRPIVQDLCLPVAAFVGGDGELAYQAQLPAARAAAGAPQTPFVRRLSCTLVDDRCAASLQRLAWSPAEVLASQGELAPEDDGEERPAVIAELRRFAARTKAELLARRDELNALDRGLALNLKRTAGQIESMIEKICVKAERVHANRTGKGQRHVRRVLHTFFPRGVLQERVLGPLTFMATYGRTWLDELFGHLPAIEHRHLLATFVSETDETSTP